jgi:3-methylfumaryl-CoA hydratase
MTPQEIDIDYLRTWIGKQEQATDTITPELLKRYTATLNGYTELRASHIPLGIHWCLTAPAVAHNDLGVDGHPAKGGFLPPVPLSRRMWASSRLRFFTAPQLNTAIERTSTISDVMLKQGATSGPLVFVQVDHLYTQKTIQSSETLLTERQTIVYRNSATFKRPVSYTNKTGECSLNITPDSRLLFRYSALTFNAHRIHYDDRYATVEEGYPGLVVHGPLMAALLMNLVQARHADKTLQSFEFRGAAPAFAGETLQLMVSGERTDHLEVINHEQASIMTASAEFAENDDC